jgi:hypothetical protein
MKILYYIRHIFGKSSAINPAKLDIRHIWAVIQSFFRSLVPARKHVREQIIWRRGEIAMKSPKCWKQGHCIQCGCFIVEKTTADMGCENEPFCYPEMMSRREWIKYKEINNIKLF